ncbi:putative protein N(5)-glutamine methyltransferase [Streptomyces cadmiisoli]|uniref:putative protein N(5)-glutamine methyltransferase n=1 Tax=Streptomyces cadmiisoli TaxID=2184053 RepID=UPI003D760D82
MSAVPAPPAPSVPPTPFSASPAPGSAAARSGETRSSVVSSVAAALRAAGCVFAEEEAELIVGAAGTPAGLAAAVDRRVAGEPLELVVGWAGFDGLRIAVEPGVFVPRRRTEFLVEQALAQAPDATVVVDLCCGSGAVGAALAARLGGVELHAADIDPAAVRCARRNVEDRGGRVYEGDLYAALPGGLRGRVDVLAANVPYVPTAEVGLLPAEARDHEPLVALDGGADGLAVLRRVAAEAGRWLAPGGCLLVETSEHQAASAVAAFGRAGLTTRLAVCGERDAHVVIGVAPRAD